MPDVRALFAASARTYDLLNHLFSLCADHRWRAALGRAVPATAARVLDVCTGTGDVAFFLARRLPAARVTGIDFSERMLELGRRKARRRRLEGRVELVLGDALRLPFADRSFDAVTVAFGLRNLTDRRLGLREMARVLRPGGRLLVLEFSPRRPARSAGCTAGTWAAGCPPWGAPSRDRRPPTAGCMIRSWPSPRHGRSPP